MQRHLHLLSPAETFRRLPQVLVGLVAFGAGIGLMVEADLGLGPWDVFHQGFADLVGWSVGRVIILTGLIVVLGFIPLREQLGLGTILNAIVIGLAADATLALFDAWGSPAALAWRFALMALGPVIVAIGSGLYLGGGLGPGPRDGIMTGLAKRGIAVWKARTGIEVTVLIAGLALGGTIGIGTVWFAVGIGPMVQWFLPRMRRA